MSTVENNTNNQFTEATFKTNCMVAGFECSDGYELLSKYKEYGRLLPIIIQFLKNKENSRTFRGGLVNTLSCKAAKLYFDDIYNLYLEEGVEHYNIRYQIGCALADIANIFEDFAKLYQLLCDKHYGTDRIGILYAFKKFPEELKEQILKIIESDHDFHNSSFYKKLVKSAGGQSSK